MAVGYARSPHDRHADVGDVREVLNRPLFALPTRRTCRGRSTGRCVVPFAVTGLAAAMSATAVVTTLSAPHRCRMGAPRDALDQPGRVRRRHRGRRLRPARHLRPHRFRPPTSASSPRPALASRIIAFAVAALLLLVALQPALIGILTIMPRPVMASALLFTAVFIMIGGVQIISTRVLDGRRTLVIGLGIMSFVAVSVHPQAFTGVPGWAQPLVTSPLVLATLVALAQPRIPHRHPPHGDDHDQSRRSEPQGGHELHRALRRRLGCAARRHEPARIRRAADHRGRDRVRQCQLGRSRSRSVSTSSWSSAVVSHIGLPLQFPDAAPSQDELLESDDGALRLAGFLIRRYADKITVSGTGGTNEIKLHFDH